MGYVPTEILNSPPHVTCHSIQLFERINRLLEVRIDLERSFVGDAGGFFITLFFPQIAETPLGGVPCD